MRRSLLASNRWLGRCRSTATIGCPCAAPLAATSQLRHCASSFLESPGSRAPSIPPPPRAPPPPPPKGNSPRVAPPPPPPPRAPPRAAPPPRAAAPPPPPPRAPPRAAAPPPPKAPPSTAADVSAHHGEESTRSTQRSGDVVGVPSPAAHAGRGNGVAPESQAREKYEDLLYDIPQQAPPSPGVRASGTASWDDVDKTIAEAAKAVAAKPSPYAKQAAATGCTDDPLQLRWRKEKPVLEGAAATAAAPEQLSSTSDDATGAVRLRELTSEEQSDADAHALPTAAVEAEDAFRASLLNATMAATDSTAVTRGEAAGRCIGSTSSQDMESVADRRETMPLQHADASPGPSTPQAQQRRGGLDEVDSASNGETTVRPPLVAEDGLNRDAATPSSSRHIFAISLPEAVDVPAVIFYQEEAMFEEELLDQLHTAIDSITAAFSASRRGDDAEEQSATESSERRCSDRVGHRREVILSCAESCHFFTPRVASYVVSGAVLLKRQALLQRIRDNQQLSFIAKVERTSSALDVGAEIFLACETRYLSGTGCVGFPSLRLGYTVLPATLDVLCGALGVERTALWTPTLHETDARTAFCAYGLIRSGDVGAAIEMENDTYRPASTMRRGSPLQPQLERRMLRLCSSTTWRERLLQYVFLSSTFDAKVLAMPPWARHFADTVLISQCTTDKQGFANLVTERTNSLAASANARRAMQLQNAVATAARRPHTGASSTVPVPRQFLVFRGRDASWDSLVHKLDPNRSQVLVFDLSPRCRERSEALLATLCAEWNGLEKFGVVLIGRPMDTELAARGVKLCALVSPSGWARAGEIPLYEVAIRHSEHSSRTADALVSAATEFVAKELGAAVVRTAGNATDRLLAAFCLEVCRLLQTVEATAVESISREVLALDKSALLLLDYYGAEHILFALNRSPTTPMAEVVPVCGREALLRMKLHGLLGSGCSAGGFYSYHDRSSSAASMLRREQQRNPARRPDDRPSANDEERKEPVLNPHVLKQFLRPSPSAKEVAHRLLFSLVNECCALLTDGSVLTASDANLLVSHGFGVAKPMGGVLGFADNVGLERLLEQMQVLSNMYGASYGPHRLLVIMHRNDETFETLTLSTLEQARRLNV